MMIQLIADASFNVFEAIIRETITSNFYIHQRIMMEKCISLTTDESTINAMKDYVTKLDENEYTVEILLELLKNRHQQWQLLTKGKDISQDFTLADPFLFMQEVNSFQDESTSKSDKNEEALNPDITKSSYLEFQFFPPHETTSQNNQICKNSLKDNHIIYN